MSSQSASGYCEAVIKLQIFELDPKPCDVAERGHNLGDPSSPSISVEVVEAETAKGLSALSSEKPIDADISMKTRSRRIAETTATVQHVFNQSTKSVAMKVLIDGYDASNFVKLFDRKEAADVRLDESIPVWTEQREIEYHEFILSGQVDSFFTHLMKESEKSRSIDSDITTEPWTVGQEEAFVQYRCQELFKAELAAYQALKPLQDICVPRFISAVIRQPFPHASPAVKKFTNIPGLLLAYIKGFTLDQLSVHVPRGLWQLVCSDVVRAVGAWGELGVLNRDVRPENCVVRRIQPRSDSNGESSVNWGMMIYDYRPVIIDFDAVRLRKIGESDEEWKISKADVDEVGVMGMALMQAFGPMWGLRGYIFDRNLVERQQASGVMSRMRPIDFLDRDVWDDSEELQRIADWQVYPRAYLVDEHDDLDSTLEEADLIQPTQ